MKRLSLILLGATAFFGAGCAPSFDPPSEVKSLRVLAVKKDKPYAQPGEEVTLSLLWHDPLGPRAVERLWLGGCTNPPADLYAGCFATLSEGFVPGSGDTFSLTIPDDVVLQRQPGQPSYGLSYVFFAVCAGTIELAPEQEGLPIRCVDDAGRPLGADDFVAGYTAIYSFDEFTNNNPKITGFRFQGRDVTPDCTGVDCIGREIGDVDCSQEAAPCVPACPDDGEPSCPEYEVMPVIDQAASVEADEVSAATYNADFQEQIWINYYVDSGTISPAVKLVNDATKGWNPEQQADFRAAKDPGLAAVWAVVHDNRGGVEFARYTIKVE